MKKLAFLAFALVVILGLGYLSLSGHLFSLLSPENSSSAEFQPDDWTAKMPVPLPLLGSVEIDTGHDHATPHPTSDPVEFNSSAALDRDTWKVIVINQFMGRSKGTYQWDKSLLRYMKYLKTSLTGVGLPTEVWFMRLNRPYRKNGWTLPVMYRECGADGKDCFDEYLILAQSSLDYSLERDYLSTLTDRCDVDENSPAMAVLIVDPEGMLRRAYSPCLVQIGAKWIIRNFDYHTSAEISDSALQATDVPRHPSYPLEPSARDQISMKSQAIIQQAVKAAENLKDDAKEAYDSAVERWK